MPSDRPCPDTAQLQSLIADLQDMWPSLNPEGDLDGDAAQLFGAAGRVEVTGLALTR